MNRAAATRLAGYSILFAALLAAIYWQALTTWFHMDDFAWLGLPLDLREWGWRHTVFEPRAQGTVRIFSERLFFLGMSSLFGMDSTAFKAVIFSTVLANLVLTAAITRRLTGSTLAAVVAGSAYAFNSALAVPMAWASAYNQPLWALVLLGAFYSLIRYTETGAARYNVAQWIVFLLGFGVLELNTVYPAIAALYTFLCARRYFATTLPLFIPSALFAAAHFAFVPGSDDSTYHLYFDPAIAGTFLHYVDWAFRPYYLLPAALAIFAIWRRKPLAWFLLAWFPIVLAPVLPLKNHITDYYLTAAVIGPAILAGMLAATTLVHVRVAALLLLSSYAIVQYFQTDGVGEWRNVQSQRLHAYLEQVDAAYHRNPRRLLLLNGVDRDLFTAGFNDLPFRLYGIPRVCFTPDWEKQLTAGNPLRGSTKYSISPSEAARAAQSNDVMVLSLTANRVYDVTAAFRAASASTYSAAEELSVNVGLPSSAGSLGPGWFPVENGFRWMTSKASLTMAAPAQNGKRLTVTGFAPAAVLAAGTIRLTGTANGVTLGTLLVARSNEQFHVEWPLPASLTNSRLSIELAVDRPTALADGRTVGLIFGTFAIQ